MKNSKKGKMKLRVRKEVSEQRMYQQGEAGGRLSCIPNVKQKCGLCETSRGIQEVRGWWK